MEEKLIEVVRTYSRLLEVTSRSFKDSKAKENAWKSVASKSVASKVMYIELEIL